MKRNRLCVLLLALVAQQSSEVQAARFKIFPWWFSSGNDTKQVIDTAKNSLTSLDDVAQTGLIQARMIDDATEAGKGGRLAAIKKFFQQQLDEIRTKIKNLKIKFEQWKKGRRDLATKKKLMKKKQAIQEELTSLKEKLLKQQTIGGTEVAVLETELISLEMQIEDITSAMSRASNTQTIQKIFPQNETVYTNPIETHLKALQDLAEKKGLSKPDVDALKRQIELYSNQQRLLLDPENSGLPTVISTNNGQSWYPTL